MAADSGSVDSHTDGIRRDLERLATAARHRAELLLCTAPGFPPYALVLTARSAIVPAMPHRRGTENAATVPTIEDLEAHLRAHWADARARALVYDSLIDHTRDAISIRLHHAEGIGLLISIPYRLGQHRLRCYRPIIQHCGDD